MEANINIDDHDDDLIKKAIAFTIKEKRVNYPGHMSQRKLVLIN